MARGPDNMTSIIILTYNQLDYTKICIDSVLKHTKGEYELIVVDNASTDGTREWLERRDNIRWVVFNRENVGVPAGWNIGLERAAKDTDYYVMLNNDVVVSEGWLERLIFCAELSKDIGAVGPRCNNISGPQCDPANYSMFQFQDFARQYGVVNVGMYYPFWRLVGFCLLIKAGVVREVGKFDERFGRGNYEDDDYCLRILEAGYKNVICGDCYVHHFGSKSWEGNTLWEQLQKNKKLFDEKWNAKKEELVKWSVLPVV